MSTKAPKLLIPVTLPRRTSPSLSSSISLALRSFLICSTYWRSEKIALFLLRFISSTLRSRTLPMSVLGSGLGLSACSDESEDPSAGSAAFSASAPGAAVSGLRPSRRSSRRSSLWSRNLSLEMLTSWEAGTKPCTPSTSTMAPPRFKAKNPALNALARLDILGQKPPALLAHRPVQRQDRGLLAGLGPDHDGDDAVAHLGEAVLIGPGGPHLARGHETLGLVTEIDVQAVRLHAHHHALDHIAASDGLHRVHRLEELTHVLHAFARAVSLELRGVGV